MKKYLKPNAPVTVKINDEKPKHATVIALDKVTSSKRDGRVFRIQYLNGREDLINEFWLRKGWLPTQLA